jgi:hypothetical protein
MPSNTGACPTHEYPYIDPRSQTAFSSACRLTIERRLVDAGFAIVKERQMQFHPDSDRDMLEELFGNDAAALCE